MILYLANTSGVVQEVNYRLPEGKNTPQMQRIGIGQQVMIGTRDLNPLQVESIIQQLRTYGLMMTSEIGEREPPSQIPYVGSTDKPVAFPMFQRVMNHNMGILKLRGSKMREEMALATSHQMADTAHTPNAADTLKMSIQEETSGELGQGGVPINEGVEISREFGNA